LGPTILFTPRRVPNGALLASIKVIPFIFYYRCMEAHPIGLAIAQVRWGNITMN